MQSDHLEHVEAAFRRLGWVPAASGDDAWDVMWAFHSPFFQRPGEPDIPAAVQRVSPEQLVNQIPGASWFTSKLELAQASHSLSFLPKSFRVPAECAAFKGFAAAHNGLEWVQKGALHRGVRAVDESSLCDAHKAGEREERIVQQLVRPFLIDSKLWDMGIYVAVTNVDPLKIYVFDDMLMRHCSANYTHDLQGAASASYVVAEHYDPPWSLGALRRYYARGLSTLNVIRAYFYDQGLDFNGVFDEMKADVVRAMHHFAPKLRVAAQQQPFYSRSFFALYRFDFMLDSNLKPWLIEVNQSPNLSSAATPDLKSMFQRIAYSLLQLMGLGPGQLRSRSSSDETQDDIVHHTEIDIGWRVCSGACAASSCEGLCSICRRCRTPEQTLLLQEAVSEHRNRHAFSRLYPLPERLAARADLKDVRPQTENDALLHDWLTERCVVDSTSC